MVGRGLLTRKLLRDVWRSRWQVAAVTIMVFLGVTLFIGSYGGYLSLKNSYHHTYERLQMADYWLSVDYISQRAVKEIRAIPGVAAEGRIVRDIQMSISEQRQEKVVARTISLPGERRPRVNNVLVEKGSYFSSDTAREVLLQKAFAGHHEVMYHDVEPGDWITLKVAGRETRFRVAGIVSSPEYLWVSKSAQEPMPSPHSFGVVFLPQGRAEILFDTKGLTNEIVLTLDGEAEPGAVLEQVRNILRDYGVGKIDFKDEKASLSARKQDAIRGFGSARMITREDQPSDKLLKMDLDAFSGLAVVFPFFFLIMSAMSLYVLLGRLVQAQRPQIGLLKAIGYSRGQVLRHYLSYAALIGVAGSALGVVAGWYLAEIFAREYASALNIPFVQTQTHWALMAIAAFIGVAVSILAGLVPARATADMRPAESMRPPVVGGGRRPLLERLLPIPSWVPMVGKLALRNILRSPGRSLFMVVGMAAAVSLILVSAVFLDAMQWMLDLQFNRIQGYDAKVVFAGPGSASQAFQTGRWQGVSQAEPILEVPYRFRYGNKSKDSLLVGLTPGQSLYNLFSPQGQPVSVEPEQLLLTPYLQKQLGVKMGDFVQLEPLVGVIGARQIRVGGFVELPIGGAGFMPLKEMQQLLKAPGTATGLLLDFEGDPSPRLRQRLYDLPGAEAVEFKAEVKAFFDELMGFFYLFIYVMLFFGFALGATIVFSAITVSVRERVRDMSTLRTIGMSMWGVASLISIESLILGGLGILLGLPLGQRLAASFVDLYQAEEFAFKAIIFPSTYLVTVLALLLVLLVSEIPSLLYIKRLNLASATKDWTA